MRSLFIVVFALSISACGALPGGGAGAVREARCHAAGAEAVLGRTVDEQAINDAIQGSGALRSRVIRPGAGVSTEVDPLRLNIEVDETGRIRRLRCG